jgi:hypothetical protein
MMRKIWTVMCLFTSPAMAQPVNWQPFIVDMTSPIMGPEGKPFLECAEWDQASARCVQTVPQTLGRIAYAVLNVPDKSLAGPEQAKQGKLAIDLLTATAPVELSLADRKRIIDLVDKGAGTQNGYPMVLVARVHELLAPGEVK